MSTLSAARLLACACLGRPERAGFIAAWPLGCCFPDDPSALDFSLTGWPLLTVLVRAESAAAAHARRSAHYTQRESVPQRDLFSERERGDQRVSLPRPADCTLKATRSHAPLAEWLSQALQGRGSPTMANRVLAKSPLFVTRHARPWLTLQKVTSPRIGLLCTCGNTLGRPGGAAAGASMAR